MASIGFLLLKWGQLERRTGRPAPSDLDHIRLIRNTLCHGLEAASADPIKDAEPHVRCRNLKGDLVSYTLTDIEQAIRELEGFLGRLGR